MLQGLPKVRTSSVSTTIFTATSPAASPTTYNPSVSTAGHNHMAFRTGFGTAGVNAVNGSNVTVSAGAVTASPRRAASIA